VGGGNSYQFDIATNALFYYGSTSAFDVANRFFTFTINCQDVVGGTTEQLQFTGSVDNIAPTITNCPSPLVLEDLISPWLIYTMVGANGMATGGNQTQGLLWGISSVKYNGTIIENQTIFTIGETSGEIYNPNGTAQQTGNYEIVITLADEGGLTSSNCNLYVSFGIPQIIDISFELVTGYSDDWNVKWITVDGIKDTALPGPCNSGCITTGPRSVPSNNTMTARVSNYSNPLQNFAEYSFIVDNVEVNFQTKQPPFDASVEYTFTNVQAGSEYKVEVYYG